METRASYVLVGSFVLALVAGLLVFTAWIAKVQLDETRETYRIYFTGSVTGLQQGSPVRYRGVPVGTVSDIRLDPDNVTRVRVTIEVQNGTPIMSDSIASLEVQGITGGAYVQISGGTVGGKRLTATDAELVEPRRLTAREVTDLGVGQRPLARRRLILLVDHPDPVAVHGDGPVEEVIDTERDEHRTPPEKGCGLRLPVDLSDGSSGHAPCADPRR